MNKNIVISLMPGEGFGAIDGDSGDEYKCSTTDFGQNWGKVVEKLWKTWGKFLGEGLKERWGKEG